jgi:hypothetical protein
MNGGRFFMGQFVPISVIAKEAAVLPTSAPTLRIYRGTTLIATASMPVADLANGLFVLEVQLGAAYTAGHYAAHVSYVLDGEPRVAIFYFESLGGDGAAGAVVSQAFYDRPHARYLVQRLDSNIRRLVKNPRGG